MTIEKPLPFKTNVVEIISDRLDEKMKKHQGEDGVMLNPDKLYEITKEVMVELYDPPEFEIVVGTFKNGGLMITIKPTIYR